MSMNKKEELITPCRSLFLTGEVTDESATEIISQIVEINEFDSMMDNVAVEKATKALESLEIYGEDAMVSPKFEEKQPIYLYIDSGGGSAYSGIALAGVIESSETPIYTIVTGKAMSVALVIAMAGRYRMAYQNSTFMFHDVSFGIWSDATDITRELDEAKRLAKIYKNLVCENSYIDNSLLEKYIGRRENWYFDGITAEELGVVDELIDGVYEEDDAYGKCNCCGEDYGDCECDE